MRKQTILLYAALLFASVGSASAQMDNRDWPGFKRYEAANDSLAACGTRPDMVLMGDSITDYWVDEDPDYFSRNNFVGRGIAGQTSAQMLCRFSQDVLALGPKAVAIMAGTNDLCQQMAGMAYYPEPNVYDNIVAMCELALNAKIEVYLCSVTPCAHYMVIPDQDAAAEICKLNAQLQKYASSRRHVTYVDYYSVLVSPQNGLADNESYDGIHPKLNAYSKMERILNAAVSRQFGKGLYFIPQAEADAAVAVKDDVRKASGQFMNFGEAIAFMQSFRRRGPAPRPETTVEKIYDGPAPGSEGWTQPEVTVEYMSPFWNEINSCVYNVSEPSIEIHLPSKSNRTGAAVVICPGGGFEALSYSNEGPDVAEWFADHGIAAFVLKYRTPYSGGDEATVRQIALSNYGSEPRTDEIKALVAKAKEVAAAQGYTRQMSTDDGRRAMEYVRANASRWNIDASKIGMVGFSAGAAIALDVANGHTDASRPDFIGLIYGAMYSEVKVPDDPMPLFMASTQYEMSGANAELYTSWFRTRKPAETHSFTNARHGFGYRNNGAPENMWIQLFTNYLKNIGIIQ